MKESVKRPRYYVTALVLTVLLHLGLLMLARYVAIRSPFYHAQETTAKFEPVQVKTVDLEELMRKHPMKKPEVRERLLTEHEKQLHKLFENEALIPPPEHRLKPVINGLGNNVLEPVALSKKEAPAAPTSPRPKILEIPIREMSVQELTPDTLRIPDVPRHSLSGFKIPSITSDTPGGGGYGSEDVGLGMRMGLPTRDRSAFEPKGRPDGPPTPPPAVITSAPKTIGNTGDLGILDDLLDVRLSAYRDPETGEGYFRVDVQPNPRADRLRAIPHDMLFLLDSSASITQSKLRRFQEGLEMAFDGMSGETRFNVVAFRKESMPLFDDYRPVTTENLARARRFVEDLRSRGKTDVYASLVPQIIGQHPGDRPLLVLLISDGQTTTTELDNLTFLRQIGHNNKANASIFCFSAGDNTNSFLMNFAAYQNGGHNWYHADENTAGRELNEVATGLSEILVRDPSCTVTGNLGDEVYPKKLPHLFRGHGLSVFGRFGPNDKDVEIRVVGTDRDQRVQELIVNRELASADPVGAELALIWAGQKAAHLVSQDIRTPNAQRQAEIRQIGNRYGIVIDYNAP